MNCPHCDKSVPANASVCPHCNKDISPAATPTAQLDVKINVRDVKNGSITGVNINEAKGDVSIILTEGLAKLPTDYSLRIKNFLYEYLGTPTRPVPFGGRKAELAALDEWFSNPSAPPYGLLTAEAGRGKSALLSRWAKSLIAREMAHVVFIPVSIRFNTALATVTFTALAARLAEVYGEPIKWTNLSAEQWRGICQSYLVRTPSDGKPVVVILDGLDEAADWDIGASFFPYQPPEGVRVIVSARYLAGDAGESGWRRRLGWESTQLAYSLPLPPLTPDGLRDVLREMGNPLDKLVTNVDIISQLYRLSEGDPLLVRLYVEALLPYGEQVAMITPEELEAIPPGLAGYFERWWDEQEMQWEAQNRDPLGEKEEVLTFFNLCAAALGPLTRHDIANIAGKPLTSGLRIKRIAKEVERFIIGNGKEQGYTFSHSRLNYYFWEQMTQPEQKEWEIRFTNYGCNTLNALNDGTLDPHKAPFYAIQYYGAHLERAEAPPETFYALVSKGWVQAWNALEGTYAGFLNDVEYAWQRAEAERDMAMQIKCALCRSSVVVLSANISPELLGQAVKHGLLTPIQGFMIVRLTHNEKQRAEGLAKLASLLPKVLLSQALGIALAIENERYRATALLGLAPHLPDKRRSIALSQALEAVLAYRAEEVLSDSYPQGDGSLFGTDPELIKTIESEMFRAGMLSELAPHLPNELLCQALEGALTIENEGSRTKALSGLALYLPNGLLSQVLEGALAIQSEKYRAEALSRLAPHLRNEPLNQALQAALAIRSEEYRAEALSGFTPHLAAELLPLDAALAIPNEEARARALSKLAPHLPDERRSLALSEALETVRALAIRSKRSGEYCAEALSKLAPHLADELLCQALETALAIQGEWYRAVALSGLAPHLPSELLSQALQAALAIDWNCRAKALLALAPRLPVKLLKQALDAVLAIPNEVYRTKTFLELVSHLPDQLLVIALKQALDAALVIGDQEYRARVLFQLASHLPLGLLGQVLEVVLAVEYEWYRTLSEIGHDLSNKFLYQAPEAKLVIEEVHVSVLLGLHLPSKRLSQALEAALAISDGKYRVKELLGLAPYLPDELRPLALSQALEAALAISDKRDRAEALLVLVAYLPDELRSLALSQALEAALAIPNEWGRAKALLGLVAHLPDELRHLALSQALEAALVISDKRDRAETLLGLAPHLPDELRLLALSQALEAALAISVSSQKIGVNTTQTCRVSETRQVSPPIIEYIPISYKRFGREVLSVLTPHLPDELLHQALETVLAIPHEWDRAKVLSVLAPHLPDELFSQALEIALAISDKRFRVKAVSGLASHLPNELRPIVLSQALETALAISDKRFRVKAVSELASHLPNELRPIALSQALEAVLAISDGSSDARSSALSWLAPHLPDELLKQALEAALAITSEWFRTEALSGLAPHLPDELLKQALEAALAITSEWFRAEALSGLAPHLPDKLLKQALEAALDISIGESRAKVLLRLAPHLPDERRTLALSQSLKAVLVINIGSEESRLEVLSKLIPQLPDELLSQALEVTLTILSAVDRAEVLRNLAPRLSIWAQVQPHIAYATWQKNVRDLSVYPRPKFLDDLHVLMPFTLALADEEVAEGMFHAIQEVCEWWR